MDERPKTEPGDGVLPVLVNDLGVIASSARTLLERWVQLPDHERETLLSQVDRTVEHGIGRLDGLAMTYQDDRLADDIDGIGLAARTVIAHRESMPSELRFEILGLLYDRASEVHRLLAELDLRRTRRTDAKGLAAATL